jgi:hypothetical protein
MLIEKSKFLLLVAAISSASAACIIVDDNDDDDGVGGDNEGAGNEGGGTTKATGSTTTGAGGGGDCLADAGDPAACDSTCEGFTNCSGVENLKEGVEESLVACMNALDPVSCSFELDVLDTCLVNTSGLTCADPLSDQICTDAATTCAADQAWTDQCLLYSDMLNVTGQAAWSICLETECNNGSDPDLANSTCVLEVFFPID